MSAEPEPTPRAANATEQNPLPDAMRLGPYRVSPLIEGDAPGGLYRGERCDGLFEQVVAIKLLRSDVATDHERFVSERRTLSRLQHPNIAQLLDGGVAETGVSYIVMEHLEGVPVTQYADEHASNPRERLALLRCAAVAVEYAHQNLIAHGEIGVANVQVSRTGVVKLLDFGLAALRGEHEACDVAGDIAALGELLAVLLAADLDADLEAIIERARNVDRLQRYASVTEFIDDLDRYVTSRPVRARAPTWRYIAGRNIARHRWIVAGVTAAVLALLIGGIVATVLYLRAERLTREATSRFDDVRHLANFMLFDLYDRMGRVPGSVDVRRELADHGRSYLATLAAIPGASPDLTLEAAEGHARLGEVLGSPGSFNLGQPQAAKQNLAVAQLMLEGLRARAPLRNDVAVALARVLLLNAAILSSKDFDAKQAVKLAVDARSLCDEVLTRDPHDVEAMLLRWRSENTLGNALGWQNHMPEVVALMRAQLTLSRFIPAQPQYSVERNLLEATSGNMLGDALYYTHDFNGALAAYRGAAALLENARRSEREAPHPQADDPRYIEALGLIYWGEGGLLSDIERLTEADSALTRSTSMLERSIDYGTNDRTERLLQSVRLQHALVLSSLGQHARAVALGEASITNREHRLEQQPGDRERHRDLAVGLRPLGDVYFAAHLPRAACATFQRAATIWQAIDRGWGIETFDRNVELKLLNERTANCTR